LAAIVEGEGRSGEKGGGPTGQVDAAGADGTVTAGGAPHVFSAEPAAERDSGIYRLAEDESGEKTVTG